MDTSPSNGVISFEPYIKRRSKYPGSDKNFGDLHWYYTGDDHVYDCEDDSIHPYSRFMSESGFQSEPSVQDYRPVSKKEDLQLHSEFLRTRSTFNYRYTRMLDQVNYHYDVPQHNFEYYSWLTQIQQGRCLQTTFEKQRRTRSVANIKNMGGIYWQFNTDWQAPSWATMDWSGNWKTSQNMVKSMFADVHVTSFGKDGNYSFWAMNDRQVNYTDGKYKIETLRYDGKSNTSTETITGRADLLA